MIGKKEEVLEGGVFVIEHELQSVIAIDEIHRQHSRRHLHGFRDGRALREVQTHQLDDAIDHLNQGNEIRKIGRHRKRRSWTFSVNRSGIPSWSLARIFRAVRDSTNSASIDSKIKRNAII